MIMVNNDYIIMINLMDDNNLKKRLMMVVIMLVRQLTKPAILWWFIPFIPIKILNFADGSHSEKRSRSFPEEPWRGDFSAMKFVRAPMERPKNGGFSSSQSLSLPEGRVSFRVSGFPVRKMLMISNDCWQNRDWMRILPTRKKHNFW